MSDFKLKRPLDTGVSQFPEGQTYEMVEIMLKSRRNKIKALFKDRHELQKVIEEMKKEIEQLQLPAYDELYENIDGDARKYLRLIYNKIVELQNKRDEE